MNEAIEKVLIVGSDCISGSASGAKITGISWDDFDGTTNPKDYDLVIFDVTELSTSSVNDIQGFTQGMNFSSTMKILPHGGKIVVIGNPDCLVYDIRGDMFQFLHWTGALFTWDRSEGDTLIDGTAFIQEKHGRYLSKLSRWQNSLQGCVGCGPVLSSFFDEREIRNGGLHVEYIIHPIKVNRYKHAIAFSLSIHISNARGHEMFPSAILFLPQIDLPQEEYLKIILGDMFSIELEIPQPEWIHELSGPNQRVVDEEIGNIDRQITHLDDQLQLLNKVRAEKRECLKILYSKDLELEKEVWAILRKLGAVVTEPTEKGKEDGWITVIVDGEEHKGVLEIKSTINEQFSEGGLRQLLEWVNRGIVHKQEKFKGIFIGNSSIGQAPALRSDPFSDSWRKSAKLGNACGLTTSLLFDVYKRSAENEYDVSKFWGAVFSTSGIIESVP